MKQFLFILWCIILTHVVSAGSVLTPDELSRLKSFELNQSVCFETYTHSDKGAAHVIGYHFDTFLTEHYFIGMAIFGAVGGDRGGYGIASLGGGYRTSFGKLFVDGRLLLGSGGGGGVPAGGGFAVFPEFGAYYPVYQKKTFGFARLGYLWFPGGDFKSPTISLGMMYRYNTPFLSVEDAHE